jgi:hypothetical protein
MPMIRYTCTDEKCGHTFTKLIRKGPDALPDIECEKCKGKARRTLSSPASASKITVDNGIQARAVEIYPDIEQINREMASKPYNRGD